MRKPIPPSHRSFWTVNQSHQAGDKRCALLIALGSCPCVATGDKNNFKVINIAQKTYDILIFTNIHKQSYT